MYMNMYIDNDTMKELLVVSILRGSVIPFTISGTITLMYKYRVTILSFVPMSGNIRFL